MPETRNWATFGLGRQVEVDGTDVRDALWARTADEGSDAREEAICGLARRRDRRAVPFVAELLATGDVHVWVFEAAAQLADPSLLPLLARYDPVDVERAVLECDPTRRDARDAACAEVLSLVQAGLATRDPSSSAALFCDRWEVANPLLAVNSSDSVWFVEAVLGQVGGIPQAAASRILEQLKTGPTARGDGPTT